VLSLNDNKAVCASGAEYSADLIVVSAGVWTSELLPEYRQHAQKGIAFLGRNPVDPFISVWAPYRQLVAFNRGDGAWTSDGTAIRAQNWTMNHEAQAQQRCETALGKRGAPLGADHKVLTGLRPYSPGHKPCLLKQVRPGLWVASGGAKNGTIAAGWAADQIMRRTS
jgi:glycine/D-amino acid oxidase-like deaminating enzyme